jgi:hypothetical protein
LAVETEAPPRTRGDARYKDSVSVRSEILETLEQGPLHRFCELQALESVPRTGAAVYTIWDHAGELIYVGVSGRSPTSKTGPWGRLRSHWNGRRSGDQFCVYVADHYVLPDLTPQQIAAIADREPTLFIDDLVAERVRRDFCFRIAIVDSYRDAVAIETAIKQGAFRSIRPRLNPPRNRRR